MRLPNHLSVQRRSDGNDKLPLRQGIRGLLWLEFEDPALERDYRISHMVRHSPKTVWAMLLAAALYPFIDVTFRIGQMPQPAVSRAIGYFIEPLLLVCAFVAYILNRWLRDTWFNLLQGLSLLLYLAIGLSSVWLTMLFPDPQVIIVGHVLIAIVLFFGYLLVMLRPPMAALGGLLVTMVYATALYQRWPTAGPLTLLMGLPANAPHEFNAHTFLLVVVNMIGFFAAHTIDTNERRVFIGRRFIERQRDELAIARQKSEDLLLNILPPVIADRLKANPGTIADGFDHVAVLFADIVGFTPRAQTMPPAQVVAMLNEIFTRFDAIARRHGVEKIKTIGDAYMVAAGIPNPMPDACGAVASCALDMMAAIRDLRDPMGKPLDLRIGIHAGPIVAGVIGQHKFAYDLWGDTVNTASRMEAFGAPGRIQVTQQVYQALQHQYSFEARGSIEVKGIGEMPIWWLKSAQ